MQYFYCYRTAVGPIALVEGGQAITHLLFLRGGQVDPKAGTIECSDTKAFMAVTDSAGTPDRGLEVVTGISKDERRPKAADADTGGRRALQMADAGAENESRLKTADTGTDRQVSETGVELCPLAQIAVVMLGKDSQEQETPLIRREAQVF